MTSKGKRSLQYVVAVSDRAKCVEWMAATEALEGEKGLPGKTVAAFPAYFRSEDRRINLNKTRDWWRKRQSLADPDGVPQPKFARSGAGNQHQFVVKTADDQNWVNTGYPILLAEFERLRKAGVKMFSRLVLDIAVTLIEDSVHPLYNKEFQFNGKPFANLLTSQFKTSQTDTTLSTVSTEKQLEIHIAVAMHLGRLKRLFDDSRIDADAQYHMDESHFVMDD
ncbi:LOW QUALITY PROTEIN: Para-hydroxybenzoate-polyprenyltransferase, partial [Phytophthora megakarya]